jgi:carboxylate-amine ligase
VLRGACWLAARDGLAGHGLDPVTAHRMPAHRLVYQLLAHVKPALAELGEYWQVNTSLASVLDQGNGAIRQRQTLAHRGSVAEVISECARRTFEGCLPEPGDALPL